MKTLIDLTPTIKWHEGYVKMIDQTKLPLQEQYIKTKDYQEVCRSIYRLAIRGAPAIGVAGAYACVLAANSLNNQDKKSFLNNFFLKANEISATRPTAVNLKWAVNQMIEKAKTSSGNINELKSSLLKLAHHIRKDDISRCHQLGLHGEKLIHNQSHLMTICNTGGLATSGIGTALGVIQYAHAQGKDVKVYVCETRPLLQGSRLNTWELKRTKTPFTLITDSMAAQIMSKGKIDAIFVGADRIAANGDTANKIGTYSLAVLANFHKIPFYVVAPLSTVDFELKSGIDIPVENRSPNEITRINDKKFTIEDIDVATPAFDITPANLIHGIITEKGVANYPFKDSLDNFKV